MTINLKSDGNCLPSTHSHRFQLKCSFGLSLKVNSLSLYRTLWLHTGWESATVRVQNPTITASLKIQSSCIHLRTLESTERERPSLSSSDPSRVSVCWANSCRHSWDWTSWNSGHTVESVEGLDSSRWDSAMWIGLIEGLVRYVYVYCVDAWLTVFRLITPVLIWEPTWLFGYVHMYQWSLWHHTKYYLSLAHNTEVTSFENMQ